MNCTLPRRYVAASLGRPIRFVGLSTALANAHDLADWLGCPASGLFNFKPSVRPVPLEAHMQGYPGKKGCTLRPMPDRMLCLFCGMYGSCYCMLVFGDWGVWQEV
jgi:replicative superfamily II helicase